MGAMMVLLQKVLPVFLVLGLGVVCRKRALLNREGINALKKVAVDIALPAVMFSISPLCSAKSCMIAYSFSVSGMRLSSLFGRWGQGYALVPGIGLHASGFQTRPD